MSLVPYNIVAIAKNIIAGRGSNVIKNAPVYVKDLDGNEIAEIYATDEEGATGLEQPFYTNESGELSFYINAGDYDITIAGKTYRVSIAGDKYDRKISIGDTDLILDPDWAGCFCLFESNLETTLTIETKENTPQVQGSVWTLRNYNGVDLTIQAHDDVVISPLGESGGQSYILRPNKTVELRYIGNDFYFLTEYGADLEIDTNITEYSVEISGVAQTAPQDVNYTLSFGRSAGTAYSPSVRVKGIGVDDYEEYFDQALATESYVDSAVSSGFLGIQNKSTSTFDLDPADVGKIVRATYVGTKTMTIQPEATLPQSANSFYYVTNRSSGLLTITRGSGVTLNRPGQGGGYTTLQVQTGETIKITRVTTNNYDVEISPGNHGLGGFSIFQTGVSDNYTDQRGSGFIAFGSGYNAGIATTTSSSPVMHMEVSANGASQFLSILPSSAGANDGKLGYRDRTGAVWSGFVDIQTSKTTANVNYSEVYDNFVSTNGGVTVRLRIFCGQVSKEAHAVAYVAGTATTGTAGSDLPSLSTSILASKIYPKYGTITIPFYTVSGGNTVASGYLQINTSGAVTYSIINGTAYGSSQFESRYVCT
jgi:hypothetical protein